MSNVVCEFHRLFNSGQHGCDLVPRFFTVTMILLRKSKMILISQLRRTAAHYIVLKTWKKLVDARSLQIYGILFLSAICYSKFLLLTLMLNYKHSKLYVPFSRSLFDCDSSTKMIEITLSSYYTLVHISDVCFLQKKIRYKLKLSIYYWCYSL